MKVLVIWEEIPEDTVFIILENIDMVTMALLERCHGHYINLTDDAKMEAYIKDFFYDTQGRLKYEIHKDAIEGKYFDLIIKTGIML